MNIAFVSNFDKTVLFHKIGRELEKTGHTVFWFCFSRKHYHYLLQEGVKEVNILLLNKEIVKENEAGIVGEYKLNELIIADRALKYDYDFALKFLTGIQQLSYDFILKNDIRFIFGEITYAHEILISRICLDKFKNIRYYLHPQSIRIPNGRFTFLDTEFQDTLSSLVINIQPEAELNNYKIPIVPAVPKRVAEVEKEVKRSMSLSSRLARVKRMFTESNISSDHPSLIQKRQVRYKIAVKEELNKWLFQFVSSKSEAFFENKKYVFITLHMQPEASIDVVGRYYEDQYQMIFNVWRILPSDTLLVFKEHTNAIVNRSLEFYNKCLKLPNVFMADINASSHKLINNALAVFTNSGTVALEGALYGKNCFVFSDIFFNVLQGCHKISLEDLKRCKNIYDLIEGKRRDSDKMDIVDYSKYIIRSSFAGIADPPRSSGDFDDEQNIKSLVNGFDQFLSSVK